MHLSENGQCLLMVAQSLERLLDIEVPVAQAVEAVGKQIRGSLGPRKFNGAAEVDTRLLVIASCPEEAEVNDTLPLCYAIMSAVGHLQCLLIVAVCLFPSTLSILQGLLPGLCLVEVVGQVRQGRIADRGVEALHCFGNATVQGLALAYQQVGIHGLPCQRMAKRKP